MYELPHLWNVPENNIKCFRVKAAGKRFIWVVRNRLLDYTVL
jgi:hypothetical protein